MDPMMFKAKRTRKTLLNQLRLWWNNMSDRDPKTENVEDENVKDAEAEKIGKVDVSHATFALL